MTDDVEEMLIAWGRVYGKGREYEEERSLTGQSSLAQWFTRPTEGKTLKRSGLERRTAMGAGRAVPQWACDPIRAVQTPSFKPECDLRDTPAITRVQIVWLALWRTSEVEATALRLHYQRRDLTREDKARELSMPVHAYRTALKYGQAFMRARLALAA